MANDLTPMQVLERLIGPPPVVARAAGLRRTAAYNWHYLSSKLRQAGDVPTPVAMRRLLAYSDARGLGLTAEHLIRGASEDEIEAILADRAAASVGTGLAETGVAAE